MLRVPNPCCIPLHTCVKISATTSIVLAITLIAVQVYMIHSANRIHNSSLLPLYKILRKEYYNWKNNIDTSWEKMRKEMHTSSAEKLEKQLKLHLAFNPDEGLEQILMKEKSIRENLELPHLPDFSEMERVSYICGLNGLFGGILQLISSFTLLWGADKESKTIVKVWVAVTGGVIFSLATCLIALFLQDNPINLVHFSPPPWILFPVLGIDLLLTLYFLWIILAYLYEESETVNKMYI